jgi:succinate dehydrogenase / fumarate reductase cytochrome b subunit
LRFRAPLQPCCETNQVRKNNGAAVLLGLQKYDCFRFSCFGIFGIAFLRFWVPEMVYKYVDASPLNETRYFHELAENLKVQFVWIFPIISIIIIALVARVQFFFSIRWV